MKITNIPWFTKLLVCPHKIYFNSLLSSSSDVLARSLRRQLQACRKDPIQIFLIMKKDLLWIFSSMKKDLSESSSFVNKILVIVCVCTWLFIYYIMLGDIMFTQMFVTGYLFSYLLTLLSQSHSCVCHNRTTKHK